MRYFKMALIAGGALLAVGSGQAAAASYQFNVLTGLSGGAGFDTTNTAPSFGASARATFTYSGDINFSNTAAQNGTPAGDLNRSFGFSEGNISNYSGARTVSSNGTLVADFTTLAGFLASSGSVANYAYGSYYRIELGRLAGGTNLTITHDDGISLYNSNNVRVGSSVSGPTNAVTDNFVNLTSGSYTLYYSRQNGTPSVLQVAVPEPASLALFGAGLIGLGLVRRRRGGLAA